MKYFIFLLLTLNIKNYNCFPGVLGSDFEFTSELFFCNNVQISLGVNYGFICPFGRIYFCSFDNFKKSCMPYYFIDWIFSYNFYDIYFYNLEIDTIGFIFGIYPEISTEKTLKLNSIYFYKFAFCFDFKKFYIELRILSSSLNIFKNTEIIRYTGITIGRNFSISDGILNLSLSGSWLLFDNLSFNESSQLNISPLNRFKINYMTLTRGKVAVDNCVQEITKTPVYSILTSTNPNLSYAIQKFDKDHNENYLKLVYINKKISKMKNYSLGLLKSLLKYEEKENEGSTIEHKKISKMRYYLLDLLKSLFKDEEKEDANYLEIKDLIKEFISSGCQIDQASINAIENLKIVSDVKESEKETKQLIAFQNLKTLILKNMILQYRKKCESTDKSKGENKCESTDKSKGESECEGKGKK